MLKLIGRDLRAGVMVERELQPSTEGRIQGGPLSPILANMLLDDFDRELESRGLHFVRYADDCALGNVPTSLGWCSRRTRRPPAVNL